MTERIDFKTQTPYPISNSSASVRIMHTMFHLSSLSSFQSLPKHCSLKIPEDKYELAAERFAALAMPQIIQQVLVQLGIPQTTSTLELQDYLLLQIFNAIQNQPIMLRHNSKYCVSIHWLRFAWHLPALVQAEGNILLTGCNVTISRKSIEQFLKESTDVSVSVDTVWNGCGQNPQSKRKHESTLAALEEPLTKKVVLKRVLSIQTTIPEEQYRAFSQKFAALAIKNLEDVYFGREKLPITAQRSLQQFIAGKIFDSITKDPVRDFHTGIYQIQFDNKDIINLPGCKETQLKRYYTFEIIIRPEFVRKFVQGQNNEKLFAHVTAHPYLEAH